MSLGRREARHQSVAAAHVAGVEPSADWDFQPGQRVQTVDGLPGRVTAVQDGPVRGTEGYEVTLDDGLGGGLYTASQLSPAPSTEASLQETAAADYPELEEVLQTRPDIATNTVLSSLKTAINDAEESQASSERSGWYLHSNGEWHPHAEDDDAEDDDHDPHDDYYSQGGGHEDNYGDPYGRMDAYHDFKNSSLQTEAGWSWSDPPEDNTGMSDGPDGFGRSVYCTDCSRVHGEDLHKKDSPAKDYDGVDTSEGGDTLSNGMSSSSDSASNSTTSSLQVEAEWSYTPHHEPIIHPGGHRPPRPLQTGDQVMHPESGFTDKIIAHSPSLLNFEQTGIQHRRPLEGDNSQTIWSSEVTDEAGKDVPKANEKELEYLDSNPTGPTKYSSKTASGYSWAESERHPICEEDPEHHGYCAYHKEYHPESLSDDEECTNPWCKDEPFHTNAEHIDPPDRDPHSDAYQEAEKRMKDTFGGDKNIQDGVDLLKTYQQGPTKYSSAGGHDYRDKDYCVRCGMDKPAKGEWSPSCDTVQDSFGDHTASIFDPFDILVTASLDPDFRFEVTAAWSDVRRKAKRIRAEGGVHVTLASDGAIFAEVKGDHNVYETGLQRLPGKQSAQQWSCGCKWGAYHWGADDDFSRFAGRMCSHALALQFEAQSRGMFGRTITPDGEKPSWAPRRVVVKYDIDDDKNRTAPATMPEYGRMASLSAPVVVPEQSALSRLAVYAEAEGMTAGDFIVECVKAGLTASVNSPWGEPQADVPEVTGPTRPPHKTDNPASQGWASQPDPQSWNDAITPDTIGMSASLEASDEFLFEAGGGPTMSGGSMIPDAGPESTLHDEPEAALPQTDGELDLGSGLPLSNGSPSGGSMGTGDANIKGDTTTHLDPDAQSIMTTGSVEDIVASFQQKAAHLNPGGGGGQGDSDIAAAAREHLAKEAVKDFTPGEQATIINEGQGVTAANLDRLDIAGTHYEPLEAALAARDEEDDEGWMF